MRIRKVEWCLAFRKRNSKLLFESPKDMSNFTVIKNSLRYWCADPFIIRKDDYNYVFFEMYDRLKRKGAIGYRKIDSNGKISPMKKVFEDSCHLSYPFIFEKEGNYYIVPESNGKKQLYLLKAVSFPNQWEINKILLNEVRLVDTTFLKYDGQVYMFTTPIVDDNISLLSVSKVYNSIIDREKVAIPVLKDKSRARMAGSFIDAGNLIRVSQNCSRTYGGGIVFSEISLQKDHFSEKIISMIDGNGLWVAGRRFDGIHTYNCNEEYEVIDLKTENKFNLIECFGFLRNKVTSLFRKLKKNK